MSLEDFKTGTKSSEKDDNIDRLNDEDIFIDKNGDIRVVKGTNESYEHYKSKSIIAIQLKKVGYDVKGEVRMKEIGGKSGITCDLYAAKREDGEGLVVQSVERDEFDTVIVEVGQLTANRATTLVQNADCVIWATKGHGIDNSVFITENSISNDFSIPKESVDSEKESLDSSIDSVEELLFVDVDGNRFNPNLENLYIGKYKELANEILMNYADGREIDVSKIANNTSIDGYTVRETDVVKVLEELGFY